MTTPTKETIALALEAHEIIVAAEGPGMSTIYVNHLRGCLKGGIPSVSSGVISSLNFWCDEVFEWAAKERGTYVQTTHLIYGCVDWEVGYALDMSDEGGFDTDILARCNEPEPWFTAKIHAVRAIAGEGV